MKKNSKNVAHNVFLIFVTIIFIIFIILFGSLIFMMAKDLLAQPSYDENVSVSDMDRAGFKVDYSTKDEKSYELVQMNNSNQTDSKASGDLSYSYLNIIYPLKGSYSSSTHQKEYVACLIKHQNGDMTYDKMPLSRAVFRYVSKNENQNY